MGRIRGLKTGYQMKISTKITIAITLTSIVFIAILSFLITIQFSSALKVEAERNLMTILNKESEALNAELLRVKRLSFSLRNTVINTIDFDQATSSNLDQVSYMDQYKTSLIPHVQSAMTNFDNISGWILFNSNVVPGKHTVSYTYESGAFVREPEYDVIRDGFSSEPWWREAITYGEYWTEPYFWEPWQADVISYSIPIIVDERVVAVTGAEFFMGPFQERLRQVKVYNTGFVMLISEEGKQIVIPSEVEPESIQNWYQNNKVLLLSEKSGIQYLKGGSLLDEEIIAWKELDNGWFLIARPEASEMFSALKKMGMTIAGILLLAFPLSLIIGITLSKSITTRLHHLVVGAENVLNDQLSLPYIVEGNDEIGVLVKAFNRMFDDIRTALSELRYSESQYRTLVENSEHMIFTLSLDGKITTSNLRLENLVGKSKEALLNQSFEVLFKKEKDQLFWRDIFVGYVNNPEIKTVESSFDADNGETRQLVTMLIPIFDENGSLASIMGTSSDITDQIIAERQIAYLLEKENEKLTLRVEEKSKALEVAFFDIMQTDKYAALGRLVAGIAHELNTPIGNAVTLTSYLQDQYVTKDDVSIDETVIPSLEILNRNLCKAIAIIEHFKLLSIENYSERIAEIQLKLLIDMSLASLKSEFNLGQVEVQVDCEDDLKLKTYPGAFTQIITHLLHNAFKHAQSRESGEVLKVSIAIKKTINGVTLTIADNGVGMSPEIQEHVFEPFYTTKRSDGNTGLGLSIVFNLVTGTFGGKVFLESIPYPKENHGTMIHCSFNELNEVIVK